MTDKELIKQEIERRINLIQDTNVTSYADGWIQAYKELLQFIDSLPEEHVSEDLKKEISKWRNHYISVLDNNLRIDLRDIEVTANHFAEWQKQQMMKDAVEGTVVSKERSTMPPFQTKCKIVADRVAIDAEEGDKVTIIVI